VSPKTLVLLLVLLLHSTARTQIELHDCKEEAAPHSITITLGIRSPNDNVQTEMTLRYPGTAKRMVQNGRETVMLSNKQASIVAFNFRAGTQANDSVALALSSSGRLVYFFDLNHVVADLIGKWKKNLDEASFRVTDIDGESIILDYYEHYSGPENLNFRVVTHVSEDGNIKVNQDDIKALPR
jgi:hypothetical protein